MTHWTNMVTPHSVRYVTILSPYHRIQSAFLIAVVSRCLVCVCVCVYPSVLINDRLLQGWVHLPVKNKELGWDFCHCFFIPRSSQRWPWRFCPLQDLGPAHSRLFMNGHILERHANEAGRRVWEIERQRSSVLQCTAALPYCFNHKLLHRASHHEVTAKGILRQAKRGLKWVAPSIDLI